MTFNYLIKSPRHLVQYLACNILTKDKAFYFYVTSWIPDHKDPLTVDAKMILLYESYHPKEKAYRRRKAGIATVKYLRLGQLCILLAERGKSPFFQREAWTDIREKALCIGPYAVKVNRESLEVSVRLHKEAQKRLERFVLNWGTRRSKGWWERWFWTHWRYLPFEGVRDNQNALIVYLNENRKRFRQEPIDWRNAMRKKFTPEPVYLPTPREIEELLRWETKKR